MGIIKWLLLAAVTVWAAILSIPDNKIHVVFCDVGQGDAILVSRRTDQLLIDGGPSRKVLDCLSAHMPFYDRRIEAVVLTHRNSDHSNGLKYVAERYNTLQFEPALRQGQILKVGEIKYQVLWPDEKILGANTIGAENDEGIVGRISFGNFDVLLTADAASANYENPGSDIEIIKVPHHGSKYGLDPKWWAKLKPDIAVISVGKNNYGHPTPELLNSLRDLEIKIMRTDKDGDIEIVSDGKHFEVK